MKLSNNRQKSNNPLFFFDKEKGYTVNPIYMIDEQINTNTKFAINKNTDKGKWVRSGMLFYKYQNLEIYTDINNVIFVDLESNVVFIKDYDKIEQEINPVDPEKRQYIILFDAEDLGEEPYTWESIEGRTNTYTYIRDNIDWLNFNPQKSIILTENVAFKDALTVSQFIKHLQNSGLVEEDGFDIDEY